MKRGDKVKALLVQLGARLKRDKKHLVYALPNGRTFTMAATPSDVRAEQNQLTDLRRAAGLERAAKPPSAPKVRRVKPGNQAPTPWRASPIAAALITSGVAADAELAKAREVERMLRWRVFELEHDLAAAQESLSAVNRLWAVRLWRWWRA